MQKISLFTFLGFFYASFCSAAPLVIGQDLPDVNVKKYGQLEIKNNKIAYSNWNTKKLGNKVYIIQAIAGRSSAKELNAPLMDKIRKANFPAALYQTLTIVNQDDAIWGTGSFVKSSIEDSKLEFPHAGFVLDESGQVAKAWELKEKNAAIIVLDKNAVVRFAKQGALTEKEIAQVITLVTQLI